MEMISRSAFRTAKPIMDRLRRANFLAKENINGLMGISMKGNIKMGRGTTKELITLLMVLLYFLL